MVLEQWEIELRKQLEDTHKPKEKTWEDRLKEQISNIQPSPKPVPKKIFGNNILFVLVIVLVGALLLAYGMKSGAIPAAIHHYFGHVQTDDFPGEPETPPTNPLMCQVKQLRVDLEKMKAQDASRYAEIKKQLSYDDDRITLLGMANNENWLVLRNEGLNGNQIYFAADWTLSKQPQYLQLTKEDMDFLQKYRKKK